MQLTQEQATQYERDGYLVLKDFISPNERALLNKEVNDIIMNIIATEDIDKIPEFPFFSQIEETSKEDLDYFLQSGNKMRLFMNHKSVIKNLSVEEVRKNANKIGHALHAQSDAFRDIATHKNVKEVVKSLGYKNPVVCQSMYILKQEFSKPDAPGHQDATYLQVEPNTLIGFWIAMEDSTEENGCLKFIPGSHEHGLKRKYIHLSEKQIKPGEFELSYTDEQPHYDQSRFVSVPIKAGSAILINSLVMHKSTYPSHETPTHRDVFAFHIYDAERSKYLETNWMKFTPETFVPVFE